MQKPVMLLILDGWGYRANVTPDNAIEQGHTPNWHNLLATCPHCFVETSGYDVGLPEGQMGNSEVGHTNLGAGRVVMQDLPKIDLAIKDGSLEKNPTLVELINKLKETKGTCHLMGLMSPGGVHSHQKHIEAVCGILQKNGINVDVHAFLDGRDTPPQSGKGFLSDFENNIKDMPNVKLATIAGRFYAMDRDKRWDRVEKAYDNIVLADGKRFATADEAITASYNDGVTDEFVVADFRIVEGEDEFADSLFAVKEPSHHGFVPDTQRVSLFGDAADGECNSCCDEARNDGPDDDFRPVHGKSLFFCEDTVFRRERQRPACRFRARDEAGPHGTAGRGKGNRKVLNREQE